MEHYKRFEKGVAIVFRVGSGKIDQDERFSLLLAPSKFGQTEDFLEGTIEDGLDMVIQGFDDSMKEYVLNEEEDESITLAPLQSVRDLLYGASGIRSNIYIASGVTGGAPRIRLSDRMKDHVAYVDGADEGHPYNLLHLVVNTEKDTQGC